MQSFKRAPAALPSPSSKLRPRAKGSSHPLSAPIAPFLRPANPQPCTRFIFAYYNVRTKQTVYSLQRNLDNKLSLQQLPFVGKQTRPTAVRKDVWLPLLTVVFPQSDTVLYRTQACYRQLCEYKKLHELSPPEDTVRRSNGQFLTGKPLGHVLMNQRWNAVADLAAVLSRWPAAVRERLDALKLKREQYNALKARKSESIRKPMVRMAATETRKIKLLSQVVEELVTAGKTEVQWANVLDAEYAGAWPQDVVHAPMEREMRDRHCSPLPVPLDPQPELPQPTSTA